MCYQCCCVQQPAAGVLPVLLRTATSRWCVTSAAAYSNQQLVCYQCYCVQQPAAGVLPVLLRTATSSWCVPVLLRTATSSWCVPVLLRTATTVYCGNNTDSRQNDVATTTLMGGQTFTGEYSLNLRNKLHKLLKDYIWSTAVCGAEIGHLR